MVTNRPYGNILKISNNNNIQQEEKSMQSYQEMSREELLKEKESLDEILEFAKNITVLPDRKI